MAKQAAIEQDGTIIEHPNQLNYDVRKYNYRSII